VVGFPRGGRDRIQRKGRGNQGRLKIKEEKKRGDMGDTMNNRTIALL
jgi:hypothetical protein